MGSFFQLLMPTIAFLASRHNEEQSPLCHRATNAAITCCCFILAEGKMCRDKGIDCCVCRRRRCVYLFSEKLENFMSFSTPQIVARVVERTFAKCRDRSRALYFQEHRRLPVLHTSGRQSRAVDRGGWWLVSGVGVCSFKMNRGATFRK